MRRLDQDGVRMTRGDPAKVGEGRGRREITSARSGVVDISGGNSTDDGPAGREQRASANPGHVSRPDDGYLSHRSFTRYPG